MANGLLYELKRIAESSKDIPQESVNRLMLSALAELVEKVDKQTSVEETKNDSIDTALGTMNHSVSDLNARVTEISAKLTILTNELSLIKSNPLVAIGGFIRRHPIASVIIMILVISASIVLISSKPFLILLLTLIGIPREAIEQILLLMS